jgi:YD repeat-containing protein
LCDVPNGQSRCFTNDWQKRLLTASNPESGRIAYTYDTSGNLGTRLDANGITTTSTYDGLNRISTKSYSDGTAQVRYCYDNVPNSGTCQPTAPAAGYKGRLTYATNGTSSTLFGLFDSMGRVRNSTQTTNGTAFPFTSYTYDLAGELLRETYPSGRTVTATYERAGRITSVSGARSGVTTPYLRSAVYAAQGSAYQLYLGNYRFEETCYNSLLQPAIMRLGGGSALPNGGQPTCADSTDALHLTFDYGSGADNGNVMAATILARPPAAAVVNASQSFVYDAVNRLKTATEAGNDWQQTSVYDQFGNRAVVGGTGWQYYIPGGNWTPQVALDDAAQLATMFPGNRWSGAEYDNGVAHKAGNVTALPGFTFAYDAENRLISSAGGGATVTYSYDGDGRRVMKATAGGASTVYVYDAAGQLAAEYASGTPPAAPCTTCYLTADHLGSTRATTDGTTGLPALRRGDHRRGRTRRDLWRRFPQAEVHRQRAGCGDRAGLFRGEILVVGASAVDDAGLGGYAGTGAVR